MSQTEKLEPYFGDFEPMMCINDLRDKFEQFRGFQFWIQKGLIYHHRHTFTNDDIIKSVLVHELHNIPVKLPQFGGKEQEPAFSEVRFRKLTEKELQYYSYLSPNMVGKYPIKLIMQEK